MVGDDATVNMERRGRISSYQNTHASLKTLTCQHDVFVCDTSPSRACNGFHARVRGASLHRQHAWEM